MNEVKLWREVGSVMFEGVKADQHVEACNIFMVDMSVRPFSSLCRPVSEALLLHNWAPWFPGF